MNKKSWIVFIILVVGIIGGMVYMSMSNRLDLSDITKERAMSVLGAEERNGNIGDHTIGANSPKVTLIEYADYQCPGCASTAPIVKELAEKYSDSLQLVFRNYPITTIHPNARVAAATAEAAGLQGKFWEMHNLLFEKQNDWSSATVNERLSLFLGYGEQLGLDRERLERDLSSEAIKKKIDFDTAVGRIQQVSGTPAFFLNGKELNVNDLEKDITNALKDAGVAVEES